MVARYSDEYTSGLPSDYNGRYVKYDDYEELEAERDELQRRLDDILAECFCTRDVCARTITAIAEGKSDEQ